MVAIKKIPRRSTQSTVVTRSDSRSSPESSPLNSRSSPYGSLALIDSVHSPFHIHSSDHPGLQLVSIRLDDLNFDDWEAVVRIALDAKNKIGFIDGSLSRPAESETNFRIWSRCNSMVKAWLLNSVSPQIYRSILRMNDVTDIWKDLYGRFHMSNLPRTFNLTQQIQDLRQGNMSLSVNFTKFKTLWSTLYNSEEPSDPCICGHATRLQHKAERNRIVKFLAGLNDSYANTRMQIILKKVLPTLAEVYNMLDQDENQKGSLLWFLHQRPFKCMRLLILQLPLPMFKLVRTGKPVCSFCNKVGHIAERCYKKHGFPPGYPSKGKGVEKLPQQKVVAQDTTRALTIGQGKRIGNLYVLETPSSSVSVNAVGDLSLWHKRLGHPSFSRLEVLSSALGTASHKNKESTYCHVCHLDKQSCHSHLPVMFVVPTLRCYTLTFVALFQWRQ